MPFQIIHSMGKCFAKVPYFWQDHVNNGGDKEALLSI